MFDSILLNIQLHKQMLDILLLYLILTPLCLYISCFIYLCFLEKPKKIRTWKFSERFFSILNNIIRKLKSMSLCIEMMWLIKNYFLHWWEISKAWNHFFRLKHCLCSISPSSRSSWSLEDYFGNPSELLKLLLPIWSKIESDIVLIFINEDHKFITINSD